MSDRGRIDLSFEPSIGPIGWETQKLWRVKVHEFCQNVQGVVIFLKNIKNFQRFFLRFSQIIAASCTFWQNSWTLTLHNFTTFVFLNRLDRLRAQMKDLFFLYRTHTTLTGCGHRKWPENVSRRWSRNYIESVRIKKLFFVPKIITLLGYSIKQTAFENIKPFQRYLNYSQKQHFYTPQYYLNIYIS